MNFRNELALLRKRKHEETSISDEEMFLRTLLLCLESLDSKSIEPEIAIQIKYDYMSIHVATGNIGMFKYTPKGGSVEFFNYILTVFEREKCIVSRKADTAEVLIT